MLSPKQKALLNKSKPLYGTSPYDPKKPTIILTKKKQPPVEPKRIYYKKVLV